MSHVSSSWLFIERKPIKSINYSPDKFNDLFGHILIETNNICTRACSYCYFWLKNKNKTHYQLSSEAFYNIIDQLHKIDFSWRISFFAINEPLTDSRIFDFVRYAKKLKKSWKMLVTNWDLLTQKKLDQFIAAGLNQLAVSVYDDRIFDLKNELIVPKWTDFILDFNDYRNFPLDDNRWGSISSIKYNGKYWSNACERIFKILVIKASWNIVPCFWDFFEKNIMWNIYNESLSQIRFGDKFKKFRSHLAHWQRKLYKICQNCNYPWWGWFFTIPKKNEWNKWMQKN